MGGIKSACVLERTGKSDYMSFLIIVVIILLIVINILLVIIAELLDHIYILEGRTDYVDNGSG